MISTKKYFNCFKYPMKAFHYISDIHLEKRISYFPSFYPKHLTQSLPLFLAGDIGNPSKENYFSFLSHVSDRYKTVFLVAGNHEFTRKQGFNGTKNLIRKIAGEFPNVFFLDRKCVEFENVIVAGCTLWTPSTLFTEYIEDVFFVYEATKKASIQKKRLIVMTHHLPTVELINKKFLNGNKYNIKNWASRSETVFDPSIDLWICGHSHDTVNKSIQGITFLMNSKNNTIATHRLLQ